MRDLWYHKQLGRIRLHGSRTLLQKVTDFFSTATEERIQTCVWKTIQTWKVTYFNFCWKVISHFFIRPLIFMVCASNFAVFMGKCFCKFKAGKGQSPAILLKIFLSGLRILFFWEVMLHNWVTESQHFEATLCYHFQGSICPWRMPGAGGNVTLCIGTVYLVVGCL